MKRFTIILFALTMVAFSCNKTEDNPIETNETSSFTMTYDGITYTEADPNSLVLGLGTVAANGTTGDGFLLTVIGVGADGTTVNICPDPNACDNICTLTLDFGAVAGNEGFVATSGTVKRTGNKIEISATGIGTTNFETKSLTATIVVGSVIEF